MKKLISYIFLVAIFSMICYSCKKDDNNTATGHAIVEIKENVIALPESNQKDTIEIHFSRPSPNAGSLLLKKLSGNASYGVDYKLLPMSVNDTITIPITQGQTKAHIIVESINNNNQDGNRHVAYQLVSRIQGVSVANNEQVTLSIIDDEQKPTVEFNSTQGAVSEDATDWYEIKLKLSHPTSTPFSTPLRYQSSDAQYNQHFYTDPPSQNHSVKIIIPAGAVEAILKVKPLKDNNHTPERNIHFSIDPSQEFLTGQQNAFDLKIVNNHSINFVSIESIRNLYKGAAVYFLGPKYIKGTVTSANDNIDSKTIYVQDGTGGIAVTFKSNHDFQRGDSITLNIESAALVENDGELFVKEVNGNLAAKTGTGALPVLQTNLEQLMYSFASNEGKLVSIYPVSFTAANGANVLSGDKIITDRTRNAIVRTESFASFANHLIPGGNRRVTGILIQRGNEYIIKPQTSTDIK